MSRILVIGGSGQIGLEIKNFYKNSNFIFPSSRDLDITNINSIKNFLDINSVNLILNLAAYTDVDNAEVDKNIALNINHLGAKNIAKESSYRKIGLIHFSTDYVFGKNNKGINSFNELTSPLNYYGLTKSLGEKEVLSACDTGLIIRLASVYGYYGDNFIRTIIKLLLTSSNEIKVVNDQKISLTGSYELVKNLTYLIDLYYKKININEFNPKILHFTNKGYTNWFNVAKIIKDEVQKLLDKKLNVKLVPIKSNNWTSLAKRPLDSRLKVDFKELEVNNILLPRWDDSVRIFVRKILPNIKSELSNES